MSAPNDVRLYEDGTGFVLHSASEPPKRVPLKAVIPGFHLLEHPCSRLVSARLEDSEVRLRLGDDTTWSAALSRLTEQTPAPSADAPPEVDLLIQDATLMRGPAGDPDNPLDLVEPGAVAIRGSRVVAAGPVEQVCAETRLTPNGARIDAGGKLVSPGLVDPHTHVVFAGDRSHEFALRARGATYLEIAAAGGGIRYTVAATRQASDEELERSAALRIGALVARGVTTAEAKSGYGLTVADELRILEVIGRLDRTLPIDLSPTLLGAHVVPAEYADRRHQYVELVCAEMIPRAAAGLAEAVDVYCDPSAFDLEESRRILETAREHGLALRIHAEQFENLESAAMAARLGAVSADHLEAVSAASIAAMARAGTVAVLLPGAALTLRCPWPPAAALISAGVEVALGTDLNPGTSMTENLHLMMSLGCMQMGMTVEQVWRAVTTSAARAACRPDAGRLAPGAPADLVLYDCKHYAAIPYHLGGNHVQTVIKSGRIAWTR
ncbi:MAG: imidazolonepropionase [bacterium]